MEKERAPIQIAHSHGPIKPPLHYITGPHPSHVPSGSGPCYVKTNSRTPTPTSYTAGSEVYVPLHTDPMSNGGSNALTATSTGVAVVTINQTPGDMSSGVNMV